MYTYVRIYNIQNLYTYVKVIHLIFKLSDPRPGCNFTEKDLKQGRVKVCLTRTGTTDRLSGGLMGIAANCRNPAGCYVTPEGKVYSRDKTYD